MKGSDRGSLHPELCSRLGWELVFWEKIGCSQAAGLVYQVVAKRWAGREAPRSLPRSVPPRAWLSRVTPEQLGLGTGGICYQLHDRVLFGMLE